MTYLQLLVATIQESGISGATPTTVSGAVGMVKRMADWINLGWIDLQDYRDDFKFMYGSFSFNTVADTQNYTLADASITDLNKWNIDTFKIFDYPGGQASEVRLPNKDFTTWDRYYNLGEVLSSRPQYFVIEPNDNSITLDTAPTSLYTISGSYYKAATNLIDDTDVPAVPTQYQNAIIQRALWYYGIFISSPEVTTGADEKYKYLLSKIQKNQVPARRIRQRPFVW